MRINSAIAILAGVVLSLVLVSGSVSSAKMAGGPFNLVASDSGRYVQLNWDSDFGKPIRGYNIYRSAKVPDNWEKLNEGEFFSTSFVDFSAPRLELIFYRVNSIGVSGEELPSASIVGVSTTALVAQPDLAATYNKNNIITDAQLVNASAMNAAQIQSFLNSQGSVLANYSSGGKSAAQRIYDECQTHGISPYVVLVTLQKEKGLIRSSTANPNNFAMGWNTGDSSTSDFANQVYYGTRQFRRYQDNLGSYRWTVGQTHAVSDGTVTAASTATAGLYVYTPWIGQGGGGHAGVGGNYLFWDLWYTTFDFGGGNVTPYAVDGFDFPVGATNGSGWLNNLNGLQFLEGYNYGGSCGYTYHPGHDFNKDGTSLDQDRYEPVYAVAEGVVIASAYYGTSTWGNVILIEHTLLDGTKVWSQYGHLEDRWVQNGATVAKRQQIGRVGKGDGTLSAHLHFEMRKISLSANAFPCGQSQTYVTDRYHNPINFINGNRTIQGCNSSASTLRNRDNGPPIHPPGSVVKTASNPTVYLIDPDNRKRPLSASALSQLYNQSTDSRTSTNFNNWVITIGQDELDLYEVGGSILNAQPGNGKPFPDGKLIGYNGEISIVTGIGKRRPFTDGNRFTGLGFNFCQVVNVSQADYNSYPAGPPVDAMPLLISSVIISPAGPYTTGQNITGTFTIKNVGYAPLTFTSLGIGGRFNGSPYDFNFVSTTVAAGAPYQYRSEPLQLISAGTYDFFAAYQENNGHWALSVPAAPEVERRRQIPVTSTPTRTLTVTSSNPNSGVSITVTPNDNNNSGSGTTQFTRTYNNNISVNLTAPATAGGNNFQKWQRNGSDWSPNRSTTVVMDANYTMSAVYVTPPVTRTLTVASSNPGSGVSVTVNPNDNSGFGNGSTQFSRTYNNNTSVDLSAPSTVSGNNFQKWLRNGADWSTNQSTSVIMDANQTMTAVYVTPLACSTLTTSVSPNGGGTVTNSVAPNCSTGGVPLETASGQATTASEISSIFGKPRGDATEEAFANLISKADSNGSIGVIIGLKVPFLPEAKLLGSSAIQKQRSAITDSQDRVLSTLSGYDLTAVKRYLFIPAMALKVTVTGLRELEVSPDVSTIEEDLVLKRALAESVPLIGAPAAWANGYTGSGWTVAILDTGVDKAHPFLAGKVVSEACYSQDLCPGGATSSTSPGSGVNCNLPGCDHGTHVAGIAAGKGSSFSGVAKDANVIAIQIFRSAGSGITTGTSSILSGLQRVHELSNTFNIAAVNLSIAQENTYHTSNCDSSQSIMKAAIDALRSLGIATVIASGNDAFVGGTFTNGISSPACISSAISVGSTEDGSGDSPADSIAHSSQSSSLLSLLAPGRVINSSIPGGAFDTKSGTSMAAPHVAGAWAVLKSKSPSASVDQIMNAFSNTGLAVTDSRNGVTKPRIRVDAAANALGAVTTSQYTTGTLVTLTAVPSSGYSFGSWSGCDSPSGNNCTVTMASSKSVTANFVTSNPLKVLISEFRFHGSAGAADEFVELYNDTDTSVDISGYTLFALNSGGAQTLVFTVPGAIGSNTTTIPARGHYLIANTSYSLSAAAAPDGTYATDIPDGSGIGLFAGTIPTVGNRVDSVGFDLRDSLFFEGAALTPLGGITANGEFTFVRRTPLASARPKDTSNNAEDFTFISTNAGVFSGRVSVLGAPGPENLSSAIQRNATIKAFLIDNGCTGSSSGVGAASNTTCARHRDTTTDPANNSTFGTLSIRRAFKNNTVAPVTRLRFRLVDITTFPVPSGTADLRVRTSNNYTATCVSAGPGCPAAGSTIIINGTTLEQPPNQALGGGLNSSISAGTVTLGTPLAAGATVKLQFLLGVEQSGSFRFFINVEALP